MSNMKDETKNVPPPTNGGGHDRVTAETVVTDGGPGLRRLRQLTRRILKAPKMGRGTPSERSRPESQGKHQTG